MWSYRARLEGDLTRWREQGWIDDAGLNGIRADLAGRGRGIGLATTLAVLGAVLIGFAAMSFVAANWQEMPRLARLGLLVVALWGCYGLAGYLLTRGLEGFGHAAVLAAVGGFLNLPFGDLHFLEDWLEPSFVFSNPAHIDYSTGFIVFLLAVSTVVALTGIAIAAAIFLQKRISWRKVEPEALQRALYIDSSIAAFMGRPGYQLADGTATFDRGVIDGTVNGVGRISRWAAARGRVVQSGYVRAYATLVGAGTVLLFAYVLVRVVVA